MHLIPHFWGLPSKSCYISLNYVHCKLLWWFVFKRFVRKVLHRIRGKVEQPNSSTLKIQSKSKSLSGRSSWVFLLSARDIWLILRSLTLLGSDWLRLSYVSWCLTWSRFAWSQGLATANCFLKPTLLVELETSEKLCWKANPLGVF